MNRLYSRLHVSQRERGTSVRCWESLPSLSTKSFASSPISLDGFPPPSSRPRTPSNPPAICPISPISPISLSIPIYRPQSLALNLSNEALHRSSPTKLSNDLSSDPSPNLSHLSTNLSSDLSADFNESLHRISPLISPPISPPPISPQINKMTIPHEPHFFKPLLPGFHSGVTIPLAFFSKHMEGKTNQKTWKLRSDASDQTWEVLLEGRTLTGADDNKISKFQSKFIVLVLPVVRCFDVEIVSFISGGTGAMSSFSYDFCFLAEVTASNLKADKLVSHFSYV
ncbi:merozoite surface protein CMZ-8-like [Brassica napus]|uniref:merozoite surface protein CMZ-8-like n=1 Tax=Brassica napus TaxID=3708 RepID=UPI0020792C35|nr:merozoite surface protein CMZ-8-like [Brassica napus]